ncbi:MAG: hypothetical protein Q8P93_01015 [bacterium]|nr:hypothetical protein [bacterium]
MNDSNIVSVAQLRELVKLTSKIEFNSSSAKEEKKGGEENGVGSLPPFSFFVSLSRKIPFAAASAVPFVVVK